MQKKRSPNYNCSNLAHGVLSIHVILQYPKALEKTRSDCSQVNDDMQETVCLKPLDRRLELYKRKKGKPEGSQGPHDKINTKFLFVDRCCCIMRSIQYCARLSILYIHVCFSTKWSSPSLFPMSLTYLVLRKQPLQKHVHWIARSCFDGSMI